MSHEVVVKQYYIYTKNAQIGMNYLDRLIYFISIYQFSEQGTLGRRQR